MVRIWDPRSAAVTPVHHLVSHTAWVSALKWCPGKEEQLLSASYDGSWKVWDLRTAVPLHTVDAHTDKVSTGAPTRPGSPLTANLVALCRCCVRTGGDRVAWSAVGLTASCAHSRMMTRKVWSNHCDWV